MFVSFLRSGRRNFFEKLDEKHLANQLKDIAATANGEEVSSASSVVRTFREFDAGAAPSSSFSSSRNFSMTEESPEESPDRRVTRGRDFSLGAKDPNSGAWDSFESFNRDRKPLWQDTTHGEAVIVQRHYMQKKLIDNKLRWLKQQTGPSATEQAEEYVRELRQIRREEEEQQEGRLPFDPEKRVHDKIMDTTRKLEYESRCRNKLRKEKLENAKLIKAVSPVVGGAPTDPIKKHIERRNVRLNAMLLSTIEQFFTMNTSQILHEMLGGASIAVVRIYADKPRGAHWVYYQITSIPEGRDRKWVEKQMDTLAPKLRSQVAVKLSLGYTPELRFRAIHHANKMQTNRRIFRIAKRLQNQKSKHVLRNWVSEMNWGGNG